jgi:hypothetical protein
VKRTTHHCDVCQDPIQSETERGARGGTVRLPGAAYDWPHLCRFCATGLVTAIEECLAGLTDKSIEVALRQSIHVVREARSS